MKNKGTLTPAKTHETSITNGECNRPGVFGVALILSQKTRYLDSLIF